MQTPKRWCAKSFILCFNHSFRMCLGFPREGLWLWDFLCCFLRTCFLFHLFGMVSRSFLGNLIYYTLPQVFLFSAGELVNFYWRRTAKEDWKHWNRCQKILTLPLRLRAFDFAANSFFPNPTDENHDPFWPNKSSFFLVTYEPRFSGEPQTFLLWQISLITKRASQFAIIRNGPGLCLQRRGWAAVNDYFFMQFNWMDEYGTGRMGILIFNMRDATQREVYLQLPPGNVGTIWNQNFWNPDSWSGVPLGDGSYYIFHAHEVLEEHHPQTQRITLHQYAPEEDSGHIWKVVSTYTFDHNVRDSSTNCATIKEGHP